MKFWKIFDIFWIIFLLFFAIGLPLILHYAGDHQLSDFEMIHTSAGEAFVLLGLGTALWFIVFFYYIRHFLWNAKTRVLTVIGLLLLIALAAGILVYSYINESHGYGWRYLYFWHPYVIIPGSFIFYSGFLFRTSNGFFSRYLGK
jgi:cell division protein FtsW (lipid II flippase)